MNPYVTVSEYINGHPQHKEELLLLRNILLNTEFEETVKWGGPCYTINGKNVVGIGAFKSYVGLWFYQGVYLEDPEKVLVNAQKGTTKALRQWRFNSIDEMDPKLIKAYIDEAIANKKAGKELKRLKAKKVDMPIELKNALTGNKNLESSFYALTPGKQREYSEYIGSAKQETTRISRLEKAISLILDGKGLNDKYR